MKITVLIAEDQMILSHGLQSLLSDCDDIEIVGIAENGRQVINMVRKNPPNVVLMDIQMPELNGIEASHIIREMNPEIKILILSQHEDLPTIYRALQAGVEGFILKHSDRDGLIRAIRTINRGQSYLDPGISRTILDDYLAKAGTCEETGGFEVLSMREREVFQLLAEGHSVKTIADKLVISPKTVETHRSHIKETLGLSTQSDLIRFAIRNRIIRL
jgi:two-component system response regulator NreC